VEWRPDWPCSVAQVLGPLRHGGGDPTYRTTPDGAHWRATRTPAGPATVRIQARPSEGTVIGSAWGPGSGWALETMPRLLGADDDPSGFEPLHPPVAEAWRRRSHWRIGASDLVFETLLPTVIEQKVTGQEAFAAYRTLVWRFGEPPPETPGAPRLMLQPTAEQVRAIPSWEWLKLPVDGGRSRPLVAAARVADAFERTATREPDLLDRRLRSVPGLGVWTSAEVRQRVLGDADAVSFGDYHVARNIGWALLGRIIDDDELEELLEPYRPHRGRVQQLAQAAPPRRGPRMAPRTHLPAR
jgi:3-methyladenine DNA glycosylase/8-oxoguanine DNA glycosylase